MMTFLGWPVRQIMLPDGGRILCTYRENGKEPALSLFIQNHNIVRLDRLRSIMWQVERNENGRQNWERLHEEARAQGQEGALDPFVQLWVQQADGSRRAEADGNPPQTDYWSEGCELHAVSQRGHVYMLDPRTGLAINVTPLDPMPGDGIRL